MSEGQPPQERRSRFWLFAPVVILALVAVAWSAAWFVIRDRAGREIDAALAREAAAGRQWTCADRSIAGYPFRIEVSCATLTFRHGDVTASFGRVLAVAQVYQPRLVIAEIAGPLTASDGRVTVSGRWRLLEASLHTTPTGFQRVSLVAEEPSLTVGGLAPADVTVSALHTEAHARPDPARFAGENAYDIALSAVRARIPAVDALLGGETPTDIVLDTTLTRAKSLAGPTPAAAVEAWRQAGGVLGIDRLALVRDAQRLEGKGELRLDDLHRPTGRLTLAGAGLDGLLANVAGDQATLAGAVLGALGGKKVGQRQGTGAGNLTPLPPVRLDNGKVYLGPFPVPGVRLGALY